VGLDKILRWVISGLELRLEVNPGPAWKGILNEEVDVDSDVGLQIFLDLMFLQTPLTSPKTHYRIRVA